MRLCVVGAGYVGLVSGACLADVGHEVTLVDLDQSKVDSINAAEAPIFEPGLEELLADNVPGSLRATSDLS
ncbi:MAG: 2-dehydropantoate 2-reductase N-terminal domain-containing protein, partial [Acidimicrobiia bacterium]